jgi:hypothetical protein
VKDLRVPNKPAVIKGEAESDQGAVASLLLGSASTFLGVSLGISFHIGVREVVKGDGGSKAKDVLHALKNLLFDPDAEFRPKILGEVKIRT